MRKTRQIIRGALQNLSIIMQILWTNVRKVMQSLRQFLMIICVWIIRVLKFISIRVFFLIGKIIEDVSRVLDFFKGKE